jgi:AcrR family transcriptional regulator
MAVLDDRTARAGQSSSACRYADAVARSAAPSPSPRRSPTEDSESRNQLLDAAQQLILHEGYAAVTARRLAAAAGRKPQLIHYYFASMDDLFVQLVRRGAAYGREQLARALEHPQPLRALWKLSTDPLTTALSTEYVAVAHHRKAIAKEVAEASTQFRLAQHGAFRQALARYDIDIGDLPLGALLVALEGMARVIVMERSIGSTTFHDEALRAIEDMLTRLEGPPRS